MSSSGSYDGSEGSGYGEWYGGSHYPPDRNRARSYDQRLQTAYGASPRGRFLYIHRQWWETDDRPRRRSPRPSPDQGPRRQDRDRRTHTGPERGREDSGDRDPVPRRPPSRVPSSRGPSSRGPPSPDNLDSGRRRPRRPNSPPPGPAPASLYSDRERRPYGNLLEAPPQDPQPEGERQRRSDGYDDPAPRSLSLPASRRSSLARRGSVSPPRSRSRDGNFHGDGYDEPGPVSARGSGRRRSSGFRRGSRPSPPPRPRSRENARVHGNDDGPEPSPTRENCRRRSSGLGRRSTEPALSPDQGRRPSLSERFEARFISPVRRRLDRLSHGPTDHDRLWRSYPSAGNNRRESMSRRDRPMNARRDSDRLPGLDDRFVGDNGSPTGSHRRARTSNIDGRGVAEVGSVRPDRRARVSDVEESELGYAEMHGALQ